MLAFALAVWEWWQRHRRNRRHWQLVWAEVRETWVDIDTTTRRRNGGVLRLHNAGARPVREVIIEAPLALATRDFAAIAPGETLDIRLDEVLMRHIPREVPVMLQLTDDFDKIWHWTPATRAIEPTGHYRLCWFHRSMVRAARYAPLLDCCARKLPAGKGLWDRCRKQDRYGWV